MATTFVRAANPIWFMVDLVGQPLNDGYYAFFLSNVFPYVPQTVYQDVNGTIPWNFPIEFLPNGTLPDNMYFNDALVYRIEIRQGPSQTDPLIYVINNFVPSSGANPTIETPLATFNQANNSQFSQVNFNGTATYTVAGTYPVAPGWNLVLTGFGTATVTQNILAANANQINDPPYSLRINTSGWTTAQLVQQFNDQGAIWSSNTNQQGIISVSATARGDGAPYTLSFVYTPSSGTPTLIVSGTVGDGDYQVLDGSAVLPISDNPNLSNVTFVDIVIQLQGTGIVDITNIQIIGQSIPIGASLPAPPVFQQETIESQINQLFYYYQNSILIQPKASILTGWDFSLNPWQFTTTTIATASAQIGYYGDQTLLFQKTGASKVKVGQAASNFNNSYTVQALTADNQFALIQYIDPETVTPYWGSVLSSLVKASINTINNTSVRFKMRLIYRTTLPPTVSAIEPISSWAGVDPTFAAGWTATAPVGDPIYTFSNTNGNESILINSAFSFNGFKLPVSSSALMTLGIVVYTLDPMSIVGTPDQILWESISLVPNSFAIDFNPLTFDETLRRCQFYYEKSYDTAVLPGTASLTSKISRPQNVIFDGVNTFNLYPTPFSLQFNTVKRATPSIFTLYSPSLGSTTGVDVFIYSGSSTANAGATVSSVNWTGVSTGTKGVEFVQTNATTMIASTPTFSATSRVTGIIDFQFATYAQLGL